MLPARVESGDKVDAGAQGNLCDSIQLCSFTGGLNPIILIAVVVRANLGSLGRFTTIPGGLLDSSPT